MESNQQIKEFFTESEWDLIYDLLENNRMILDEDSEELEVNYTALKKIRSLF